MSRSVEGVSVNIEVRHERPVMSVHIKVRLTDNDLYWYMIL